MSSVGVVVFRNSPLGRSQVLQESVNNAVNISNNDFSKSGTREVIVVRKKHKAQEVHVTTSGGTGYVKSSDAVSEAGSAKRIRIREDGSEEPVRAPTPLAVARRNARERNRVRQVNDGFAALRRHIPDEVAAAFENANSNRGPNKKLSKVETLRMAVEYIRNLETLLNIGHLTDKENASQISMESFPSPASSSPRDNSQERSYFTINSPMMDDDELEEDDLDSSFTKISQHHYASLPVPEGFQLVSTPHLYEEEDGGQPLTPSSDLISTEDIHAHILESNFNFPTSAEQFTVIPEQSFCNESEVRISESDFEVKYAESLRTQAEQSFVNIVLPLESLQADILINQDQYDTKIEDNVFVDNQSLTDEVELKKELPEIQVTPEDRAQFEETLKWWQEKTKQARSMRKIEKSS